MADLGDLVAEYAEWWSERLAMAVLDGAVTEGEAADMAWARVRQAWEADGRVCSWEAVVSAIEARADGVAEGGKPCEP